MSPRAHAWLVFALGLPVLVVLGFVTLFFAGSAASGCDLIDVRLHASFCDSFVMRRAVALAPLIAIAVYVVGGVVGIILARGARRPVLVPAVLGLLALAVFTVDLVIVNS